MLKFSAIPILLFISTTVQAQVGVSPSLNASFLQELRSRAPGHAGEAHDGLGSDRQALDRGRELSRPELFQLLSAFSDRMEADITGFNGPYQLGRKWFSPFYFGVQAPTPFLENKDGLTLGMAFEFQTEYNSLVNDGKGGAIFSPTLLWDGSYQVAENQRLTFTGGLGLNWITGNNDIDFEYWSDEFGVSLLPGTSIAYDVDLGALHLTAYDRVSARPYLGILQNDLGLAATLDLTDRLAWTLNYTFSKTYDIDGAYGSYIRGINFDMHTISTELAFKQSASLTLGLEGAWNWYQPDNLVVSGFGLPFFDDPDTYETQFMNIGLFGAWQPGRDLRIRLALGFQHYDSDTAQTFRPDGFFDGQPQQDDGSIYYSLAINQRLTEHWSHEFALGYESVLVLGGNYQLAHYANYGVTGQVWQGGQFTGSLFLEYIDRPRDANSFLNAANFQNTNTGIDLHLAQRITDKLHFDIGYASQYVYWDGDYGFNQQMGSVGLRYALSAKTNVNLGWQAFKAPGRNFNDGDHHRVLLSVRREF